MTCDDFVAAMADAASFDFTPFLTWYRQAGTPKVTAHGEYDAAARRYTLRLAQDCAPSPGQADKAPYLIPVAVGLVAPQGGDLDLGNGATTRVLHFTEAEQTFVIENIPAAPVPSLLRNFSAPVVLEYAYTEAELAHLLAHDSDPFSRWEAGQRLFGQLILKAAASLGRGEPLAWPGSVLDAARRVLLSASDPAFIAEALTLARRSHAGRADGGSRSGSAASGQKWPGSRYLATGLESDFSRIYARVDTRSRVSARDATGHPSSSA